MAYSCCMAETSRTITIQREKKKEQRKDKKSVGFLNANNELAEREIKKAIPFIITMKRIKYLGTNLTKEVKDLYTENSKTVE